MKRLCPIAVSFAAFALALAHSTVARDGTVRILLDHSDPYPPLTLRWAGDGTATQYAIYRKAKDAASWGDPIATLAGSAYRYEDSTAQTGRAYEYKIYKNAETNSSGYIYAGHEVPPIEGRGVLLLLVDESFVPDLNAEFDRLKADMVGDGWRVIRRDVDRTASLSEVKGVITQAYDTEPELEAVLIFGHLAVPYSGNIAPDGHSQHMGAWPADAYYADMDGDWTDETVNTTSANNERNHNVPGDGKFDQSTIPGEVEVCLGRVDVANMATFSFHQGEFLGEPDFARRYMDKNHEFRTGGGSYSRQAIVDDNFSRNSYHNFPWNDFTAMFGVRDVKKGNLITDVTDTTVFLFGYGAGGGSNAGAGGVGSISDIKTYGLNTVFTSFFGSGFGDWDQSNNFLRAPLPSLPSALACMWGNRPPWHIHHMALGEHIGYGTRLTQNNRLLYSVGNGIESGSANQIHIALLGDPTLRLHVVKPVSDLTLGSGGGSVSLSWSASPDQVLGYHVYRAASIDSAFARLTDSAIVATAFTDSEPPRGVNTYMVRALKLEQSASGSYYNLSTGIMDSVETNLGIADGDGGLPTGKLRMNFLSGGRSIVLSATAGHVGHATVRVLDLAGRNVRSATVRLQGRGHYRALDMRNLPAGVYVVAVELHDIAQRSRITLR